MENNNEIKSAEITVKQKLDVLRNTAAALFYEVKSLNLPMPVKFKEKIGLNDEVRRFETHLIGHALEQSGGSQVRAAEMLKIKYSTLNSKIKRYGLYSEDEALSDESEEVQIEEITDRLEFDEAPMKRFESTPTENEPREIHLIEKIAKLRNVTASLIEEVEKIRLAHASKVEEEISLPTEMRKFEVQLIEQALEKTKGNQTRAARLLGVNVTTLNNKIKRLAISPALNFSSPFGSGNLALLRASGKY